MWQAGRDETSVEVSDVQAHPREDAQRPRLRVHSGQEQSRSAEQGIHEKHSSESEL